MLKFHSLNILQDTRDLTECDTPEPLAGPPPLPPARSPEIIEIDSDTDFPETDLSQRNNCDNYTRNVYNDLSSDYSYHSPINQPVVSPTKYPDSPKVGNKGIVSVILSDPPCKDGNDKYTTASLKPLSDQYGGRY